MSLRQRKTSKDNNDDYGSRDREFPVRDRDRDRDRTRSWEAREGGRGRDDLGRDELGRDLRRDGDRRDRHIDGDRDSWGRDNSGGNPGHCDRELDGEPLDLPTPATNNVLYVASLPHEVDDRELGNNLFTPALLFAELWFVFVVAQKSCLNSSVILQGLM